MIDKTDIKDLTRREADLYEWLKNNLYGDDFFEKARKWAILTVKIHTYYQNNKT